MDKFVPQMLICSVCTGQLHDHLSFFIISATEMILMILRKQTMHQSFNLACGDSQTAVFANITII